MAMWLGFVSLQVEALSKQSKQHGWLGPSLDQRLNRARTQTYQVRTAAMLDVLKERGLLRSTSDQAVSQGRFDE